MTGTAALPAMIGPATIGSAMIGSAPTGADDRRTWGLASGVAIAAHLVAAALVLTFARPAEPPVPEPVVLVELPAEAPPAASAAVAPSPDIAPQPQVSPVQPQLPSPPLDVPQVRAPLPVNPVTLPPAAVQPRPAAPAQVAPAAPSPVVANAAAAGTSPAPGTDPRARKAEVDYFSLISAHLNRRKTYPVEAKKARQEGVVTVRFTVDRDGNVSGAAIKRSSGHDLLDQATLALLQRVAPLPKMPASIQRQNITLALPIDYSLKTD